MRAILSYGHLPVLRCQNEGRLSVVKPGVCGYKVFTLKMGMVHNSDHF